MSLKASRGRNIKMNAVASQKIGSYKRDFRTYKGDSVGTLCGPSVPPVCWGRLPPVSGMS